MLGEQRAQPGAGRGEELHPDDRLLARRVVGQREVGVAAALGTAWISPRTHTPSLNVRRKRWLISSASSQTV